MKKISFLVFLLIFACSFTGFAQPADDPVASDIVNPEASIEERVGELESDDRDLKRKVEDLEDRVNDLEQRLGQS